MVLGVARASLDHVEPEGERLCLVVVVLVEEKGGKPSGFSAVDDLRKPPSAARSGVLQALTAAVSETHP